MGRWGLKPVTQRNAQYLGGRCLWSCPTGRPDACRRGRVSEAACWPMSTAIQRRGLNSQWWAFEARYGYLRAGLLDQFMSHRLVIVNVSQQPSGMIIDAN